MFVALLILVVKLVLAQSPDLAYQRNESHGRAAKTREYSMEELITKRMQEFVMRFMALNRIIHKYEEKVYVLKLSRDLLTVRFGQEHPRKMPSVLRIVINDTIIYNDLHDSELDGMKIPPTYSLHDYENMETISHAEWLARLQAPISGTENCGKDTMWSVGDWPWHAVIYRYGGLYREYICDGTLISRRHVLTSANCLMVHERNFTYEKESLEIYFGKMNLYKYDRHVQARGVNQIFVHPEFNYLQLSNDIAIVELNFDIIITGSVDMVCLWEEDNDIDIILNTFGVFLGWDIAEKNSGSKNLIDTKFGVISPKWCVRDNPDYFSRFSSRNIFCARIFKDEDACIGTPGSGMFMRKTDNFRWQLRGIVSARTNYGESCRRSKCIVLTDVTAYFDWIKMMIQ